MSSEQGFTFGAVGPGHDPDPGLLGAAGKSELSLCPESSDLEDLGGECSLLSHPLPATTFKPSLVWTDKAASVLLLEAGGQGTVWPGRHWCDQGNLNRWGAKQPFSMMSVAFASIPAEPGTLLFEVGMVSLCADNALSTPLPALLCTAAWPTFLGCLSVSSRSMARPCPASRTPACLPPRHSGTDPLPTTRSQVLSGVPGCAVLSPLGSGPRPIPPACPTNATLCGRGYFQAVPTPMVPGEKHLPSYL
ncbi:hypothetical protein AAY473_004595 [Plecturocebus cupreus]